VVIFCVPAEMGTPAAAELLLGNGAIAAVKRVRNHRRAQRNRLRH
jgi:hypothetical protein